MTNNLSPTQHGAEAARAARTASLVLAVLTFLAGIFAYIPAASATGPDLVTADAAAVTQICYTAHDVVYSLHNGVWVDVGECGSRDGLGCFTPISDGWAYTKECYNPAPRGYDHVFDDAPAGIQYCANQQLWQKTSATWVYTGSCTNPCLNLDDSTGILKTESCPGQYKSNSIKFLKNGTCLRFSIGTYGAGWGPTGDCPVALDMTCAGKLATTVSKTGTAGDDVIVGTIGDDVILGKGGNDTICAGPGNDSINAGRGRDRVYAGPGNDSIKGSAGADKIWGGSGNDIIHGGGGRDRLSGQGGADTLVGAAGKRDACFGGAHNDTLDVSCERAVQ